MSRNPNWTRDELILALELYFRVNPLRSSDEHPEVVALSGLLNSLPIHAKENTQETFRNPSGVYMKLGNFLHLDPEYEGRGLAAGSRLDKKVWQEFADEKDRLRAVAEAIRVNYSGLSRPATIDDEKSYQDEEFPEGRVLARIHKLRERNGSLPKKKKRLVLESKGNLKCEVCDFDFKERYGEIGSGFAECHHNKPVSELKVGEKTKLSDLSIICANCHRMLHKARPWLSVQELRGIIL